MSKPNDLPSKVYEQSPASPAQTGLNAGWTKPGRLSKETKEITTLYNIAVAVGSSLNLKELIWMLYKESGRLIDTANFAVVLYNDSTNMLNFVLVFDQGHKIKPFSVKYSNNNWVVARVIATETPLLIRDFLETEDIVATGQLHANKQVRSWLGAPILNPVLSHEGVQGVIATWSYEPNHFTEHELWLLSAIGTQTAIAIRNARSYEASQQRAEDMARLRDIARRRVTEMALLNDITRTLSATLQFDEVLMRIMDRVEGILKAEAGWLLLTDSSTGDLVFQIGLGKTRAIEPFHLPRGQNLAGKVAMTGQPVLVVDVEQDKRPFKDLEQKVGFAVQSILCVPLILHDHIIGVLEVMSKKGDKFSQNDLELLNSIVPYAAIAIKNARFHGSALAERDRVIEAEDQARKALARDLHDGPTQMVSAMMMRLDFCKLLMEKEPDSLDKLAEEIATTQDLAGQAIHQIRTLLFELRPLTLEAQGLVPALRVFMDRRQQDVEDKVKLRLEIKSLNPNNEISRQEDKVEGAIFAIVQEAVGNAIKYAYADNIVVKLEETFTAIYVGITDDGDGFDIDAVMNNYEQRASLGMLNIQERADLIGADLSLRSIIGQGTRISLRLSTAKEERMKKRGTTATLGRPRQAIPKE